MKTLILIAVLSVSTGCVSLSAFGVKAGIKCEKNHDTGERNCDFCIGYDEDGLKNMALDYGGKLKDKLIR